MKKLKLLVVALVTAGYCFAQDLNIVLSQTVGGAAITKICPRSPINNVPYKILLTGKNAGFYELVLSDKYIAVQDFRSQTKVAYNIFFKGNTAVSYSSFKIQKTAIPNSLLELKMNTTAKYSPTCFQ